MTLIQIAKPEEVFPITEIPKAGKNDGLDAILSPDDKLILRCVDCQTFLLPRELNELKRRVKDNFGRWTWDVRALCPLCYPKNELWKFVNEPRIKNSSFVYLTRHEYDITRQREAMGLTSETGKIAIG